MSALAIGMPEVHRLGFNGTGYRLLGPTFLNLGLPVLLLDRVFLPDAAELGLVPFSSTLPRALSAVRLQRRTDEMWVFAGRERVPRVRLRLGIVATQSARCWVVACDTFRTSESWSFLWRGYIGAAELGSNSLVELSSTQNVS